MLLIINENIYQLEETPYPQYEESIYDYKPLELNKIKSDFEHFIIHQMTITSVRYKSIYINGKFYIPKLIKKN